MRRIGTIGWIALGVFLLGSVCQADDNPSLAGDKARESYSLGYEFGANIRNQGVEVDADLLLAAVREGLEGRKAVLRPDEIRETLKEVRRKAAVLQDRRYRERLSRNLEEGKEFLAANAAKDGVTVLPSGLQYRVLKEGDGPVPRQGDVATLAYRGTLIDGTEFDSTYARGKPEKILVGAVIRGWTEALTRMPVGSRWRIFVPPDLGYGKRSYGRIPPNSTLVFDIELLSAGGNIGEGWIRPVSPAHRREETRERRPVSPAAR